MEETNPTIEEGAVVTPEVVAEVAAPVVAAAPAAKTFERRGAGGRGGQRGGPRRGGDRPGFERAPQEFDQKTILARRVTRVVAGGRRFSLSVAVGIGDHKGRVGLGSGKAIDTSVAINKAAKRAKKNLIELNLTKNSSIPHDVTAKYASSRIMIMPNRGRGIVAGSAVRDIINLAGLKDVTGKVLSGSKNKFNIAQATMLALSTFAMPKGKKKAVVAVLEAAKEDGAVMDAK